MTNPVVQLLGGATMRTPHGLLEGPAMQRHRIALLAILATAAPKTVSRDRLMALLWPERDATRGRALLNLAVHVLRGALGHDAIRSVGDQVVLDGEACDVDVLAFTRAVADRDPETAVARYGGALLDGLHIPGASEFSRWLDAERDQLSATYATALAAAAQARRRQGDRAGAADLWRRLGAHAPHDDAVALRVMRGLAMAGARAEAIAFATRHADALRADLDAEPSAEVVAFAERLRMPVRRDAPCVVRADVPDRDEVELLVLKGRHFWAQRGPAQLRKAIGYFERALTIDPDSAAAYAGLADAWSVLGFYAIEAPGKSFPRARRAAKRALELAPNVADSYASLAYVRMYHDWRWDAAARGFQRALRIDPRHPKAHQWLGNLLVLLGRHDEAMAQMAQVRALMPLSPMATSVGGWACYHAGRYDEALDHLHESIELDPHFPVARLWLGQVLSELGDADGAIASLRTASDLFGGTPAIELVLAQALARAGATDAATGRVERLRADARRGAYVPRYELAKTELMLGHRDRARTELDRAYDERSLGLAFLRTDPDLSVMRDAGDVSGIARQMGLG